MTNVNEYHFNLFESVNYIEYLNIRLGGRSQRKGLKSKLAKSIGCSNAYLTNVLREKANLSLEQAMPANDFFQHSKIESEYFLFLVQRDRSGNHQLKRFFQDRLDIILTERSSVAKRLGQKNSLSEEEKAKFYSSFAGRGARDRRGCLRQRAAP